MNIVHGMKMFVDVVLQMIKVQFFTSSFGYLPLISALGFLRLKRIAGNSSEFTLFVSAGKKKRNKKRHLPSLRGYVQLQNKRW